MVKAGWVELHELHIGYAATGAPGHGDAVPGGGVGIGRVQIDLARAAGREHGVVCRNGQHCVTPFVQYIGTVTTLLFLAEFASGDQIYRDVLFEDGDVGVCQHAFGQCLLHRFAGGIGRMDDAAATVAALAREVEVGAAALGSGKRHALVDQPTDSRCAALDHKACRLLVAQAGAGRERIADMLGQTIVRCLHRSDPALCPGAGAVQQPAFGDNGNLLPIGQFQGE